MKEFMRMVRASVHNAAVKKRIQSIGICMVALLVTSAVMAAPTYAYGISNSQECSGAAAGSSFCQESSNITDPISGQNGNGIVLKVARLVILGAGVAATIVIILAGLTYVTSGGDPAKTETAKNAIIYALVGLVVILLAQGIISLVISKT